MMTKLLASAALLLAALAWSAPRGATSAPAAAVSAPAPTVQRAFHPQVCTEPPPEPVFDATTGTCQMDTP